MLILSVKTYNLNKNLYTFRYRIWFFFLRHLFKLIVQWVCGLDLSSSQINAFTFYFWKINPIELFQTANWMYFRLHFHFWMVFNKFYHTRLFKRTKRHARSNPFTNSKFITVTRLHPFHDGIKMYRFGVYHLNCHISSNQKQNQKKKNKCADDME